MARGLWMVDADADAPAVGREHYVAPGIPAGGWDAIGSGWP